MTVAVIDPAELGDWRFIALVSLVCGGFGVASGYLAARVPLRWLRTDRGILHLWGFEHRGRCYQRVLSVRSWKDRLPEAGRLFGGASKRRLPEVGRAGLVDFAAETRRAELVHWANLLFGFTFLAWVTTPVASAIAVIGVAVHLPFIVVQRYNRAKIQHLIDRRAQRLGTNRDETTGSPVPHAGDAPRSVPRHRWLRRILRGWVALTLVVLFGIGVAWLAKPVPRPVTLAEAAARLEQERQVGASRPADSGTGSEAGLQRPAEGVYLYEGEGTEGIAGPIGARVQGPEVPATVTWGADGCWSFRVDYSSVHWQRWDFCVDGTTMVEVGGASTQQLDLGVIDVTVETTTTCDEGTVVMDVAAAAESTRNQRCVAMTTAGGPEVVASGPATQFGLETVSVGAAPLSAVRVERERSFSGAQWGSEQLKWVFDASTGLPIENRREVELVTDSPLGQLTYRESGRFRLIETEPATDAEDGD